MSSSLTDSSDQLGSDSPVAVDATSTGPFEKGCFGYDPHLPPQRFDSISNFTDESPRLSSDLVSDSYVPPPIHISGGGLSLDPAELSPETNGELLNCGYVSSDGPILPSPAEMQTEEGFAIREWKRKNAIRLEEKEKREKELLSQIIDEADGYKVEFQKKRLVISETTTVTNREKEKLFLVGREKFLADADNNYWKAIAGLIPNEVPAIEKKGKKDQEKKLSIVVVQGPKPGKPTDLSRMRQILLKLKHSAPPHLKPSPPAAPQKDVKTGDTAAMAPAVSVA